MELGDRIRARLAEAFQGLGLFVTVPAAAGESGFIDVTCDLPDRNGKDWRVTFPIAYGRDGIEVQPTYVESGPVGGPLAMPPGRNVPLHLPAEVHGAMREIAGRIERARLRDMTLNAAGNIVLDALAGIVKAHAEEDEAALTEAMDTGRVVLLTYRPRAADMLPARSDGPRP